MFTTQKTLMIGYKDPKQTPHLFAFRLPQSSFALCILHALNTLQPSSFLNSVHVGSLFFIPGFPAIYLCRILMNHGYMNYSCKRPSPVFRLKPPPTFFDVSLKLGKSVPFTECNFWQMCILLGSDVGATFACYLILAS